MFFPVCFSQSVTLHPRSVPSDHIEVPQVYIPSSQLELCISATDLVEQGACSGGDVVGDSEVSPQHHLVEVTSVGRVEGSLGRGGEGVGESKTKHS